ncbi:MAG: helix-turn-helix domain-containing protein [Persicimonas sp.]
MAFGGGKGGIGRSTMCAEVARSIARKNQRVLCLDASWSCPTLNVLLHAEEPRFDFRHGNIPPIGEDGSHVADFIVETGSNNVWLANIGAARHFPYVRPRLGADALVGQLHELEFDWVLIDLSPGLDPLDVGLFTLSDVPVLVCSPEPASVRMSTQYLRSAFYQAIGYHPQAPQARDDVLEMLYEQPLNLNLDSLLDSAGDCEQSRHVVLDTGRRFDAYLVVNLVREGSERDLGHVLCHAWHQELNIFPRVIASIDYEDRRWFYNRRTTGLGPGRGDEALSKDTERLAKNLLDISLVDARFPRPVPRDKDAHPALQLGISTESARNEIRQHCRRLWEGYRREESISLVFSDGDERKRVADELETLYRQVLTMSSDTFKPQQGQPANRGGPRAHLAKDQREKYQKDRQEGSQKDNKQANKRAGKADKQPDEAEQQDAVARGHAHPPEATSPAEQPEPEPSPAESRQVPRAPSPDDQPDSSDTGQTDSAEAGRDAPPIATPESTKFAKLRARTDSPGEIIATLRRQADLSLQDLSKRTHIGIKYLAAIEDADLEVLPRPVYLRGYLREIARIFDVEAQPLIEEYFRFLDEV